MRQKDQSVIKMTSSETQVSTEPIPVPKSKEPINLLTGVFLKSVYFLDVELTKCAVTGIFKNRNNSLGFLIKGRKGVVFWSYDDFCQVCDKLNVITLALLDKYPCIIETDTGISIKVHSVFGQYYAYVSDGEHSVTLNGYEWDQLIKNIPLISRGLLELFYIEDLIQVYIDQVLSDSETCTDQLPSSVVDRLYGELSLWRL